MSGREAFYENGVVLTAEGICEMIRENEVPAAEEGEDHVSNLRDY